MITCIDLSYPIVYFEKCTFCQMFSLINRGQNNAMVVRGKHMTDGYIFILLSFSHVKFKRRT